MIGLGINKLLSEKNISRGDNMKKNKITEIFIKGKGYYVLLFVGVLAVAAVAIIGSRISTEYDDPGDDYIDINEPDNNIVADDQEQTSDELAENQGEDFELASEDVGEVVRDNDSLLEFDVFTEDEEEGIEIVGGMVEDPVIVEAQPVEVAEIEVEPEAVETTGSSVQGDNIPLLESLSFGPDQDLIWPVVGNVIRNYNMDHVVYYPTLMQYKCSPAIVIDAEVGTEVKAARRGIITAIENSEETGVTVTTEIGDGYSLVYGQLSDVELAIGDKVNEGQVMGKIGEPTRYYIIEGSNLYFQVLKDEETLNPMLFLE